MSRRRTVLLLALVGGGVAYYVRSRRRPEPSPFRPAGTTPPPRSFTATAPVAVPAEPAAAPSSSWSGSAEPLDGGASPGPAYVIKGNRDSMIFHTADSPSFDRTVAEVWFDTEASAVAAGFRPPKNRGLSDDTVAFAAPVPEADAVEPGPYAGSALPLADGTSPARSYVIKGNEDSMLYHEPEGRYFDATEAEVWFETSQDAEAAGFARPGSE